MEQENYIDFKITENQAKLICKYFYKNIECVEEYEICEMLDKIIDSLCVDNNIENHIPHID